MKPKKCYDHTAERARRMMRLHDGLINTRQRSIRRDWKSSFCRLMHWPQCSQIERVDSSEVVVILRNDANLTPDDFRGESLDDLLRAALTFGISALDRYVHERVVKGIVAALKCEELSAQQEDFSIPAVLAIRVSDAVARSRREGRAVRPANEVRMKVQELLHKRSFQSWREIEYAFQLLGIRNLAGQLQTSWSVGDIRTIRDRLNKIVARRNTIVH